MCHVKVPIADHNFIDSQMKNDAYIRGSTTHKKNENLKIDYNRKAIHVICCTHDE